MSQKQFGQELGWSQQYQSKLENRTEVTLKGKAVHQILVLDKKAFPDVPDKNTGADIKEIRESFGLSQVKFAKLGGWSRQYLWKLEKGEKNIGSKVAAKIEIIVTQLLMS